MKKLLFLGIDNATAEAFAYARSKGAYIIVADYLDETSSPLKAAADEFWQIDVLDVDALERRCRETDVTHVFAGSNEFCLDSCKQLCERLGASFYASDEGWRASRDKEVFKEYCKNAGLDVPRQYWIGGRPPQEVVDSICFPVVVKPSDACAKRGFAVVDDKEELETAIEKALAFSKQKRVIVEDYIEGNLVAITCCFRNRKLHLLDIMICLPCDVEKKGGFCFAVHYSELNKDIEERTFPLYEKLVREMNCKHGTFVFQSILRNRKYYHLEVGYRLDGISSWRHIEKRTGINQLKYMVDLALDEETDESSMIRGSHDAAELCALVAFWGRPERICSIRGRQELYDRSDTIVLWDRYQEGDTIPDTDDLTGIALMIEVFGASSRNISEKILRINDSLHYYDEAGADILYYHDNFYEKYEAFEIEHR